MSNKSDKALFAVTCSVILTVCFVTVSGSYQKTIVFTDVEEASPEIPCKVFSLSLMSMRAIIGKIFFFTFMMCIEKIYKNFV